MISLALPSGIRATVDPCGATLVDLWVPDREGRLDDILLGHEVPGQGPRMFYGSTVGRYANRIAGAAFTLDGQAHRLAANDGPNCLHGGPEGFDARDWQVVGPDEASVTLQLVSPDGDQGFPGRLTAQVAYALSEDDAGARLDITMTATTDRATPVSLTNHAYVNLGGVRDAARLRGVGDHRLSVAAARLVPVDAAAIPLAEAPVAVEGTPFDFRHPARIGDRVRVGHPQLLAVRGIDHCFCLDGDGFRQAARLEHPETGRVMAVWTDQPGLQVYSGNWLDGTHRGKDGVAYRMGDAICLEPGAWPDAPNRPDFPSAILRPGECYRHRMALVFPTPR